MGATIEMAVLLYVVYAIFVVESILVITWIVFLIQQWIITVNLFSTKKMKKMRKEYFSNKQKPCS